MTSENNAVDVYRVTDRLDAASLQAIADRLEARAKHPRFSAMIADYLEALDFAPDARVLELGSGTGPIARRIAARPGYTGKVLGIDLSPYLTAIATRLARQAGIEHRVEFRIGDCQQVNVPDASFDVVLAHTLISHVHDPGSVLRAMRRALAPGGKIGLFDGDYASMTFAHDDTAAAPRYDQAIIGAIATQPRIMRELPQLLHDAGFALLRNFSYCLADAGRMDYWESSIQSFLTLLPKSGALTEAETRAWVDCMRARSARGVFFGACNFHSYIAAPR